MKLDVSTLITNLKGEPLKLANPDPDKEGNRVDSPDLTLADVLINAALTPNQQKTYKESEHVARYQLAINTENARSSGKSPIIEISAETAAFIKEDIGRLYPSLVAGQVMPLLDGK